MKAVVGCTRYKQESCGDTTAQNYQFICGNLILPDTNIGP